MLKKIRDLTYQHAILAALIAFVVLDLLLIGLGRLFSLLPKTLPGAYMIEIVMMLVPALFVWFFGFSRAFKTGKFWRGLLCCLPLILVQLFLILLFFLENTGNPEVSWRSGRMIVYGLFSILGVGVREEFFYRATLQNIVARKYANSVRGIWITVIVASLLFGLCHISNLFFDVEPLAVLVQVISAAVLGLVFGAAYLRSGSIWALVLVHTLTDVAGLASSTFLNVSDIEDMNRLSGSESGAAFGAWIVSKLLFWLVYIGIAAFLLRPSKCRGIIARMEAERESDPLT